MPRNTVNTLTIGGVSVYHRQFDIKDRSGHIRTIKLKAFDRGMAIFLEHEG